MEAAEHVVEDEAGREGGTPEQDDAPRARPGALSRLSAGRSRAWRALVALAVLSAGSLWSWRSLIAAGITDHAPVYRNLGVFGAGGDNGQAILFMKWLPFALSHGMNPFFSRMLFAPSGINVLSNTSCLFESFVLAPITIWWGPVAAFDGGVVLAPIVSGGALYYVLRRYRITMAPALISALLYGYSPYLMKEAPLGHFHASWIFFPPLALYLLDEILARQQIAPWKSGVALGLLTVAQFFSSLEILLDTGLIAAVLVIVAAVAHPRAIRRRFAHAVTAGGIAAALAGALLAYPLWFALAGPQHVSVFNASISTLDQAVTSSFWPSHQLLVKGQFTFQQRIDAGFIGLPAFLLALAACVLWRRQRLVPYAICGFVVSSVVSWGPSFRIGSGGFTHVKAPDSWLLAGSLLRNLQPYRFAAFADLFAAVAIAIVLDRSIEWLQARRAGRVPLVRGAVALVAGAAVLALPSLGVNWHEAQQSVSVPKALTNGPLARARIGTTVLVSPSGYVNNGSPLVWQAVSGLRYDDVQGYAWRQASPDGGGTTLGAVSPLSKLLGPGAFGSTPMPPVEVGRAELVGLRSNILRWGVADIVLAGGISGVTRAHERVLSSVIGERPQDIGGSLVWTDVTSRLSRQVPRYPAVLVTRR